MTYDVIVAGFGTAGAVAAIAAARQGAKVLVLEKGTYPGGLQTGGFITGYYVQEPTGLAGELESEAHCYATSTNAYNGGIEAKKWVLEQQALGAGVDLRYEVSIRAVQVTEGRVRGLIWEEGGMVLEAMAAVVIDATAEAEIALLAGCTEHRGRPGDGLCQHAATIFRSRRPDGSYSYQAPALRACQHDAAAISTAMLRATANLLGAGNLTMASDLPGMREGRHVPTRQVLTLADCLLDPTPVSDPIAYAYSHVDTNISDYALESETFQDWMVVAAMWGTRLWFAVPQGALIAQDVRGLLLAGRHVGVDHDTGHALRMNAGMGSVGEAAGVLAALAVRLRVEPAEVPHAMLAAELRLPSSPLAHNDTIWRLADDEIRAGLASEEPGKAIWSAYRNHRHDLLRTCLSDAPPDSRIAGQAAFGLALLGDTASLPVLRSLAEQRSSLTLSSAMRDTDGKSPVFTVRFVCVAAYLLGRLGDVESVDRLACLLGEGDAECQSCAFVALLRIGEAHPGRRAGIVAVLRPMVENPAWTLSVRFIKYLRPEVRVDDAFRALADSTFARWEQDRRQ